MLHRYPPPAPPPPVPPAPPGPPSVEKNDLDDRYATVGNRRPFPDAGDLLARSCSILPTEHVTPRCEPPHSRRQSYHSVGPCLSRASCSPMPSKGRGSNGCPRAPARSCLACSAASSCRGSTGASASASHPSPFGERRTRSIRNPWLPLLMLLLLHPLRLGTGCSPR